MRLLAAILPLLSFITYSQPLVHQEPHHIPVFQNSHVRVLNVVAEAGDTTQFHIHKNDIAYFTVRGSSILLQELNAQPRKVELPTGWTGSDITHSETPLIHRFANVGTKDFHLIAVEVLSGKYSKKKFTVTDSVLHQSERFCIVRPASGFTESETPAILIELKENGDVLNLDYLKPGKEMPVADGTNSTRMVIIQFK